MIAGLSLGGVAVGDVLLRVDGVDVSTAAAFEAARASSLHKEGRLVYHRVCLMKRTVSSLPDSFADPSHCKFLRLEMNGPFLSLTHSFIRSFVCSCVRSLTYSFIHSFIYSAGYWTNQDLRPLPRQRLAGPAEGVAGAAEGRRGAGQGGSAAAAGGPGGGAGRGALRAGAEGADAPRAAHDGDGGGGTARGAVAKGAPD